MNNRTIAILLLAAIAVGLVLHALSGGTPSEATAQTNEALSQSFND